MMAPIIRERLVLQYSDFIARRFVKIFELPIKCSINPITSSNPRFQSLERDNTRIFLEELWKTTKLSVTIFDVSAEIRT
jgi:hypothetical protein